MNSTPDRGRGRSIGLIVVIALSVAIGLYAVVGYTALPLGRLVHPDMRAVFLDEPVAIFTHVFSSAVALGVGAFQFVPPLRRRVAVHRLLGRIALVALGVGGASGLYLGFIASGGPLARAGYISLAVAWLASAALGWWSIRVGRVDAHRRWMVRSFALTFAGVTLRLQVVLISAVLGVPFIEFYAWVAWTCWMPNLVVAELVNARMDRPTRRSTTPTRRSPAHPASRA